jgi:hypothetical protein
MASRGGGRSGYRGGSRGGVRGRNDGGRGGGNGGGFNNNSARPNSQQPFDANGNPRPQCQVCAKYGHTAIKCWKRFNKDYTGEENWLAQDRSLLTGSTPTGISIWEPLIMSPAT